MSTRSTRTIRPMRLPLRPLKGRWPRALERRAGRFFWADPTVVTGAATTPEEFRRSMSAFAVGGTIKITRRNRHPQADRLLLDHVDVTSATILDVGASDGSTSMDLLEILPDFGSYIIADLYLYAGVVRTGRHTYFYAPDGQCFMVVGRRVVAWPSQSPTVRALYTPLLARARRTEPGQILLVNPRARARAAEDPRVQFAVHDVFSLWSGPRPDVIKVANLLRRDYFSNDRLETAMAALLASLDNGGHLLLVNNPRIEGVQCEGGLYRRSAGRFETVATTDHVPDVDDLVRAATLKVVESS